MNKIEEYKEMAEDYQKELEILYLKGPWCNEFMLRGDIVDGQPHFIHWIT